MNSPWHMQRIAAWHRAEIEQDIEMERLAQLALARRQSALDRVLARVGLSLIALGENLLERHDPACYLCAQLEVSARSE